MEATKFDRGQACLNGHGINGNAQGMPAFNCTFCPKCGESTILNCQNGSCSAKIRGNLLESYGSWEPDNYCHQCGSPYPWTVRRMESLAEAIDEVDHLVP